MAGRMVTSPRGWSTKLGVGLSMTRESEGRSRSGKTCLRWDWQHHRNSPNHQVNTQSYFFDNALTFQNPKEFANIGPNHGLTLWFKQATQSFGHRSRDGRTSIEGIPLIDTSANALLRLEVLSGDHVIGKGWYYLTSPSWACLKFPYALAQQDPAKPITDFRLIAPTHVPPDWWDCGPTVLWLDDVQCCAGDATYNGVIIESFEDEAVPSSWRADDRGRISTTNERFKSGMRSLLWSWEQPRAALTFSDVKPFINITPNVSLAFWLYNEKATGQRITLELLCDGKAVGSCWYFLNYHGWRALAAPYAQIGWKQGQKVNGFRLVAPQAASQGQLCLDFVNFQCQGAGGAGYRPATPAADYQQPWIGRPELLGQPDTCCYSDRDISLNRPWLSPLVPAERIPRRELEDMDKLRAAVMPVKKPVPPGDLAGCDGVVEEGSGAMEHTPAERRRDRTRRRRKPQPEHAARRPAEPQGLRRSARPDHRRLPISQGTWRSAGGRCNAPGSASI